MLNKKGNFEIRKFRNIENLKVRNFEISKFLNVKILNFRKFEILNGFLDMFFENVIFVEFCLIFDEIDGEKRIDLVVFFVLFSGTERQLAGSL